jgi:hypothetical protein
MTVAPTMPTAIVTACVGQARREGAAQHARPRNRHDEEFEQIAEPDQADERADHEFERPETRALEEQQPIGDERRDGHARDQRQMEQQREADRAAEEFGEIGGHGVISLTIHMHQTSGAGRRSRHSFRRDCGR